MSAPLLLPASARTSRPWKNGGGKTQDVLAVPPGSGMDDFKWRISIAEVNSPGPFSQFPGVDRHLAVLSGRMSLAHGGDDERTIGPDDLPYSFPGDQPTFGRPIGGPARDLNLMVRRDRHSGSLHRIVGKSFDCDADVTVIVTLVRTTVSVGPIAMTLAPLDAIVLSNEATVRGDGPLLMAEVRRVR